MAKPTLLHITLQRDGHDQPWGFRLQGGTDHSRPLQVQRVCIGSPSESSLQRGDTIIKIGNQETSKLTHQDAHDIIKHAGNALQLTVHRSGVDALPHAPASPLPSLSVLISEAAHHEAPPLPSPTPSGLPYHTVLQHPVDLLPVSKPLPSPKPPLSPREPPAEVEDEKEKEAIHMQPYRTTPLITPSVKAKKDLPTGTYMKYQTDPKMRPLKILDNTIMKDKNTYSYAAEKVFDSVTTAASQQQFQTSIPGHKPLSRLQPQQQHPSPLAEDGDREVVNLQYNSPLSLYSQDNVSQAMKEQTGLTPKQARVVFKGVSNKKAPAAKKKSESLLPKVYAPSKSPTFSAVADEEWGNLQKASFDEKRPPAHKIKTVPAHHKGGGMGMATEKIAQSASFMRVMHEIGI